MSKKSFIDSVRVKDPCTEAWDEMAGGNKVRFCSHCAKDVNNLSAMTRKEAVRLVRSSGGKLCVRYRTDPVTSGPLFARRVSGFVKHTAAAGVLGASLLGANVYAQGGAEPVQLVQIERTARTESGLANISGFVTDPNGAAIPYALVSITNEETFLSHLQNASADGFYEFKDIETGTYKIRFEAGGFSATEIEKVQLSPGATRRDGQLNILAVAETVEVKTDSETWTSVTVGVIGFSYETQNELVAAVLRDDLEDVKARIVGRAKINVKDKTLDGISPLHAAVENGNFEIAEYLLAHGAKPNIRDSFKRTPLMMMDEDGSPELFQLLIRYGAKPALLDKQKNSILHHFADSSDDADLVRQLAAYLGNINAVNRAGKTALMIAVENDRSEVVKALIESGADVNARDRDGRTVLDFAGDSSTETRMLLETYGAVRSIR